MTTDLLLFIVLALVAVASALGMLISLNAIYSALFLIVNFATVAIFYLILGAPFLALAQVTVYAGAIMVLFLFVIMLLAAERVKRPPSVMPWQGPLAVILGVILVVEGIYVIFFRSGALPDMQQIETGFGSPAQVGLTLFNQYLLPFEITSILLLVAMIGAIALTQIHRKDQQRARREKLERLAREQGSSSSGNLDREVQKELEKV